VFDVPKVLRGLLQLRMLLAAALLCGAWSVHANTYKVGVGTQCSFGTIAEAIDAALHRSGSPSTVYIATNQAYTNQAISINPIPGLTSGIILVGGVPSCTDLTPAGTTTVDGGNAGTSVITIRGAIDVTLSHLTITGGNDVIGGNDDEGGGIDYAGVGSLSLDNTTVFDNHAENGGGIRFKGDGGAADLYLNANTFITNNTANATGGGIRVEDNGHAHIDADPTWIAQNEATSGYGGGIAAVGGAYVHIGSPGYLFGGVIYQNTAQYGGGIALISGSGGVAQADVFASDPAKPVRIEQNRAYHTGGGVYLVPYTGFEYAADAALQFGGAQIDSNAAQEGSGIYDDTYGVGDLGGDVHVYAGHCAAGIECNTVSNNRAVDGGDNPTAGSAILIQTGAWVTISQLTMRGNQGAHAIRVADSLNRPLLLDTCLIAGNTVTGELVTFGTAAATLSQCTFAYNTIGGPAVIRAETGFTLTNSIFAQGFLPTIAYTGSGDGETLDYILSMETATLGAGQHIIQADPAFVDPGNGDFHLREVSRAVDVAPAGSADDRDLDTLPRDIDLASVPNLVGPRDLGAYELQAASQSCGASDSIFCNGFDNP
jgi:hypothetical protein